MGEKDFGIVDYCVVGGTLLFSLFIGIYYALASKQTNEDLLVGGRKMKVWPIACSILVTYLSAITVIGYPAEIYAHGIQIYMLTISSIVFVPLTAYIFVYPFYGMRLTSVYEYLEHRYGTRSLRYITSITFTLQCVLITGVVVYAPSIALQKILGLPIWACIIGIGVCGTVYTSVGGFKAVIWTDVFQFVMILIGFAAMLIRGFIKSGGVLQAFDKADKHDRLNLFDLTVDPFMRHNTLNFVLGYGFNTLFIYGTSQPQVQRFCSLPSLKMAVKSLLLSVVLGIITMTAVLSTGVAIFATYAGCDPVLLGEIKKSDEIVPYFVMHELYFIPGMMGLFVSCIFSAVLSTLSSMLNSLAAVSWTDVFSHMPYFKDLGPAGQANTSRFLAAFFGVICMGFAFAAQYMGPVLQATLTAVGAMSGGLGAAFLQGLFLPCVNKWGAMSGMVVALSSMIYIAIMSFTLDKPYFIPLPTSVDNCPIGTNTTFADGKIPPQLGEFGWPEKLFTLSYILYPFVGATISTLVAVPVGILTGGCCSAKNVQKKYLHPALRGCFGVEDDGDILVSASFTRKFPPDSINAKDYNGYKNSPASNGSSPPPYTYSPLPTSPPKKV